MPPQNSFTGSVNPSLDHFERLATNPIIQTDPEGRITWVNTAFENITGFTREEALGQSPGRLLQCKETDRATVDAIRTALSERSPIKTQILNRSKAGRLYWLDLEIQPVFGSNQQLQGFLAVETDVSELIEAREHASKALEAANLALMERNLADEGRLIVLEELQRKTAEAEAAAMAKSEFLANMSHEIRTPLTSVMGFAGLLEALPDLPETARSYIRRIATSGATLLSVVNDILDFSKLDADRIELDPHLFDPAALVSETMELVALEAERKGLTLSTEGEVPAAVLADSARVRQVLLNLLGNAIKFTKVGQITVKLSYRAEAGGELRIAVTDSGIGIPADQVDRLFQRFSQVDSSNTRFYGGTGLGLAICKSLSELMGGRIGVESRDGDGSTFWFTLAAPCAVSTPPEPVAGHSQMASATEARLLLVDDLAINRELVRTMLLPFPYEVTEAANGADAVKAAMSIRFDLILMDLQMPGMDGLAATRAIRATSDLNRQTPIIALSANVLPVHVAECREAGMDDHIAKPISPAEMLTKIERWTQPNERSHSQPAAPSFAPEGES